MNSLNLKQENSRLAFLFSFISGYIDVLGILAIGGVFLSFMSGNSTRLGIHIVYHEWGEVLKYVLVLSTFVLGSFIGNMVCVGSHLQTIKRILILDIFGLSLALILQYTPLEPWSFPVLSFAMGIQNKAQVEVNNATIGKGFMTGVLYGIGEALARRVRNETTWHEVSALLMTWLLFFLGSVVSTMILCVTNASIALLIIIIILFIIYFGFKFYHTN